MTGLNQIAVVGAGAAALQAVATLRERGFDGHIVLVSAEGEAPYNLPPLSKELLTGELDEDAIRLNSFADLDQMGVTRCFDSAAIGLDVTQRRLDTASGPVRYDGLIVATGSEPIYPLSWSRPEGVHCLRTLEDARRIRRAMTSGSPRVVVIGGGFIGCEIAASARRLGLEATIVEAGTHLLNRALAPELAEPVARLHSDHGVRVHCGVQVQGLVGDDHVADVCLGDGRRIAADLVVVGMGARPATDWLVNSGLELADGVLTDPTLRTSVGGIYAAGDVARWPGASGASRRVEHWTNAREQGALAASNLLDPESALPYSGVPYVWSDQYGERLQVAGDLDGGQIHYLARDPENGRYVAVAVTDGVVTGAVGFGAGKKFLAARRLVTRRASWDDYAVTASKGT